MNHRLRFYLTLALLALVAGPLTAATALAQPIPADISLDPMAVFTLPPPNCTLGQCAANDQACYNQCAFSSFDTCAYCDRRRTGAGCSTTCYCRSIFEPNCDPSPYS